MLYKILVPFLLFANISWTFQSTPPLPSQKNIQIIIALHNMINKNIYNIIDTNYYQNKTEYIFSTLNIESLSPNNLHCVTYVNKTTKQLFIFIRGTKIILSSSLFDQKDINDCIKLQKNELITKHQDLKLLTSFLHKNIKDLHQYEITIAGHSLGAICSDILAIMLKKTILQNYHTHKINISSITFDNPGSLNQIKQNIYTNNQIHKASSGINFYIIQNGQTNINTALPQLRSNTIQIQFLLDKYKSSENNFANISSYTRNFIINTFINILNKKINYQDKDVDLENANLHLFENIYTGFINKYYNIDTGNYLDFTTSQEEYLIQIINKQNSTFSYFT